MAVQFLTLSEVLEIHRDQIARYGGSPGIRDLDLLKSAVGMPAATFGGEFLHSDLYEMAAAYVFHIVKNHPFVDGNKRTGAVAGLVFLILNNRELRVKEKTLADTIIQIAEGKMDKAALAQFLAKWSRPPG